MATRTRNAAIIAAGIVVAVIAGAWIASSSLSRLARERMISALKQRFASDLELRSLNVSVFPRLEIVGEGLALRHHGRTDVPPLITIRKISGSGSLFGLLGGHIGLVTVEGLQIKVPPSEEGAPQAQKSEQKPDNIVVDEIVADGTSLTMIPREAWMEPLQFNIRRLRIYGAGSSQAVTFRTTLVNAKPPGDIESSGNFGPWDRDEPAHTPVTGTYTFRNADLSVFNGISGKLSSDGGYHGRLDHIEVEGHTDTPDFTVKVSGNPVHLTTQFHAVVDGTDGNTWLQPVKAQFNDSSLTAQGGVVGTKGLDGKTVSLDVTAEHDRLEDMLLLGVKGKPAMSGQIDFHTKLVIPPGDLDIAQNLKLDGGFEIGSAHFSELNIQNKVNQLSHRGRGKPETPESATVASDFSGRFVLNKGLMTFRNLSFRVPGAAISLNGKYGLLDEHLDFHGTARLEAKLSQTTTGIKSFFLRAIDRFFQKKNSGAVLPIKIGGTREQPSFGLDLR